MPRARIALVERHLALVVKPGEQPAPARAQRADVRRGDDHHPARAEDAAALAHEVERPLEVLDPIDAHDGIEAPVPKRQRGIHVGGGEGGPGEGHAVHDVRAVAVEPQLAQPPEKGAFPTGNVEHVADARLRREQPRDDGVRVLRGELARPLRELAHTST